MSSTRQISLVAWREISTRIRSRAYRLSTLAIVVLAAGGVFAAQTVPNFFEPDELRVALVPASEAQRDGLLASAQAFDRELEAIAYADETSARAALEEGDVDAVLETPERLVFRDDVDTTLESIVRQSLFAVRMEERAEQLGLSLEEAQTLVAPVELDTQSSAPEPEDAEDDVGQGIGVMSSIVLLFAISFYGQWVLVGVIEEKSNRVVEVLLAAVAPWELLMGKVLGILTLAVGQLGAGIAAFLVAGLALDGFDAIPSVAFTGLAMAVLWLVIGLLLYNFLYAAVGATVNRPEEATSVSFPLMVPLMGGYFAGLILIPQAPDSLPARLLSMFPLTAPLTMPGRIASGGGSPLEVVIAVALALLALVGVIWLAGRIYAGGILQSTKVGFLTAFRRGQDIR